MMISSKRAFFHQFSPPFSLLPSLFLLIFFSMISPAHAAISIEVAEQKAKEAHDLASSDVIYQEQDFRALYFQNIQIIQLLTEIRDEMKASNSRKDKE